MAGRTVQLARKLRSATTDAERLLWRRLRDRRLSGFKFRRQVPIGPFIADFLCADARLIVELDGGQHAEQGESDGERTARLEALGYRVVRYWNNEVMGNLEAVLEDLMARLAPLHAAPHPDPLPGPGERE